MPNIQKECSLHGLTNYHSRGDGYYRCTKCSTFNITKRRIRNKKIIVEEHGGKCTICGYDKYIGALQFHHIDRKTKKFQIGGQTSSLNRIREEAKKCQLLCANCHIEIENGIIV